MRKKNSAASLVCILQHLETDSQINNKQITMTYNTTTKRLLMVIFVKVNTEFKT